jgi:hypothetical protein
MNIHIKAALTLATLAVLVLLGVTWGWAALTTPFPHLGSTTPAACVATTVHPGERIAPPRVTVSVFNASQRVGLAGRTMAEFQGQGFGPGNVGNAPRGTHVAYAQVWTKDPTNPAVRLVRSRLGRPARVVEKTHHGPGVIVMVGARFDKLVRGVPSVKVRKTTTVCAPPTS